MITELDVNFYILLALRWEVVLVHHIFQKPFGWFMGFGDIELIGLGKSWSFSFQVELFVVGLNLFDSK